MEANEDNVNPPFDSIKMINHLVKKSMLFQYLLYLKLNRSEENKL